MTFKSFYKKLITKNFIEIWIGILKHINRTTFLPDQLYL